MEQILTVAGTEQGQQLLQQLLGEMGITKTVQANTGLDARRFLETQSFELAVISAPLTDEYGEGVARLAYQQGMTEPQAHRYIEKQAMDLRITRREVAEGIISTYEN